jgi:hypothetical protein
MTRISSDVFLECSSGADIWTLRKELSESMVKRREEFVTGFASARARKEEQENSSVFSRENEKFSGYCEKKKSGAWKFMKRERI